MVATIILILLRFSVLGSEEEIMTVSLWIRETVSGKRRFTKLNKKKVYPERTVFCLRYAADGKRRWETLSAKNLNAALAARATKEAALLTEATAVASAPAQEINVDDAIATYVTTVAATRAHKTWLAYNLILTEFRKSCTKEHLDQIDKSDLTAFVVVLKKSGQDEPHGGEPCGGSRNLPTGERRRHRNAATQIHREESKGILRRGIASPQCRLDGRRVADLAILSGFRISRGRSRPCLRH